MAILLGEYEVIGEGRAARLGDVAMVTVDGEHGIFRLDLHVLGGGIRTLWKLEVRPRRAPPPLARTELTAD